MNSLKVPVTLNEIADLQWCPMGLQVITNLSLRKMVYKFISRGIANQMARSIQLLVPLWRTSNNFLTFNMLRSMTNLGTRVNQRRVSTRFPHALTQHLHPAQLLCPLLLSDL